MVEKTKIQAQYALPVVVIMIQARKKLQRPKEEEIYPEILKLVTTILGFAARLPQPNTYELQTNRTRYSSVFNSQAAQSLKFNIRIQIRTKSHNWFDI